MKVELIQLAGRDGDVTYNLSKACEAIRNAAESTELIIFPETYLTGFLDKSNIARIAEPLDGALITQLHAVAIEKNIAVVIGVAEACEDKYYNTTVLITPDQRIKAYYRKVHLWASDVGIFSAGDRFVSIVYKGVRLGFLICYDIEFPETARVLAELGVELLIITNGNMDPYGSVHRVAVQARAQENQIYAVMANRVGLGDGNLVFAGGSCAIEPSGAILAVAGRESCRLTVEIDPKQCQEYRLAYDYISERRLFIKGQKIEHSDGLLEWLVV